MSEHQGRSGRVRKVSSTPEFNPRTVKPLAIRYTDWAIRPPLALFQIRIKNATSLYLNKDRNSRH